MALLILNSPCRPAASWAVALVCALALAAKTEAQIDSVGIDAGTTSGPTTVVSGTAPSGAPTTDAPTGTTTLDPGAVAPIGSITPRPGRVAELGHAILAARAQRQRETAAQIRPVLNALAGLREALRSYASELTPRAVLQAPTADQPDELVSSIDGPDAPPQAQSLALGQPVTLAEGTGPGQLDSPSPEVRETTWQTAEQALAILREQREALAIEQAQALTNLSPQLAQPAPGGQLSGAPAAPNGADVPQIHPEVIENLEADVDAVLAAAAPATADAESQGAQLQSLLRRLEVHGSHAASVDRRPTATFRDSALAPSASGGQ